MNSATFPDYSLTTNEPTYTPPQHITLAVNQYAFRHLTSVVDYLPKILQPKDYYSLLVFGSFNLPFLLYLPLISFNKFCIDNISIIELRNFVECHLP
jgi:hypothetical protein